MRAQLIVTSVTTVTWGLDIAAAERLAPFFRCDALIVQVTLPVFAKKTSSLKLRVPKSMRTLESGQSRDGGDGSDDDLPHDSCLDFAPLTTRLMSWLATEAGE